MTTMILIMTITTLEIIRIMIFIRNDHNDNSSDDDNS